MDVIQKTGLTDVCIVVTRYFGGILLGKGGLTRAYSSAAAKAVSAAEIKLMSEAREISVSADYSLYERILRLLPEYEIKTSSREFSDKIDLKLLCRAELCDKFISELTELSNGGAKIESSEIFFADFS